MSINRRSFLKQSIVAGTALFLAPNLISCNDDDTTTNEFTIPEGLTNQNFNHGVASFDPSTSGVIIWTRYNTPTTLTWQVSTDSSFTTILRSGEVEATADRDNTVAVELQGLNSDLKLYYRFADKNEGNVSVVGETITLPANPNEVKMAVCSCSNYQAGLFNVYQEIAKSDADVVVHLGDYIYEYPAGGYGTTAETIALGRQHSNKEIVSLDEYRERYKQYRMDADLQLAHQMKPFICVWDDHEITNDSYKDGAENHQDNEGSYETRKANAIQAYSEYLPVKTADAAKIYRTVQFGSLVNLVLLDTRIIGRDKQLSYADYITPSGVDFEGFQRDLLNPGRSILGATQREWAIQQVKQSAAKWQVFGQQVLMAQMLFPLEMLFTLVQIQQEAEVLGSATPATMQKFQTQLMQLTQIKTRILAGDPTVTAQERARVETKAPYNLDAWDGYPVDREIMFEALNGRKFISLAGDTHNAWNSELTDSLGRNFGKEIATSSVSSPGLETYLGANVPQIMGFQQAVQVLVDDLNYLNAYQRGYTMVTFTPAEVKADWIFVDTITSPSFSAQTGNTISFSL